MHKNTLGRGCIACVLIVALTFTTVARLRADDQPIRVFPSATPAPDPTTKDFQNVQEQSTTGQKQTTRQVMIVGVDVIWDETITDGLWRRFSGATDITQITICARRVIVRSRVELPGTSISVFAQELRFEVNPQLGVDTAAFVTTPPRPADQTAIGGNGDLGRPAGDVRLQIMLFHSDPLTKNRFILAGGTGGNPGLGHNGNDGASLPAVNEFGQPSQCSGQDGCNPDGLGDNSIVFADYQAVMVDKGNPVHVRNSGTPGWPTSGTDAVSAGQAGSGGAGGNLLSTVDVRQFAVLTGGAPGSQGVAYTGGKAGTPTVAQWALIQDNKHGRYFHVYPGTSTVTTHDGKSAAVPALPAKGTDGNTTSLADPTKWATTDYLRAHLAFATAAYKTAHYDVALTEFQSLGAELLTNVSTTAAPEEVTALQSEVATLSNRLAGNHTYFDWPLNFAPLLALQITTAALELEVQRAIYPIYYDRLLKSNTTTLTAKLATVANARKNAFDDMTQQQAAIAAALAVLPDLQAQADSIATSIQQLTDASQLIEQQEIRDAQAAAANSVIRQRLPTWQKLLRGAAAIAKLTPYTAPIGALVDTGLSTVQKAATTLNSIDATTPWNFLTTIPDLANTVQTFFSTGSSALNAINLQQATKALADQLSKLDPTKVSAANWKDYLTTLQTVSQGVQKDVTTVQQVLNNSSISGTDVATELSKLQAEDPILANLGQQLSALMQRKASFAQTVTDTLQTIAKARDQIQEDLLDVQSFDRQTSTAVGTLDNAVVNRVSQMSERAQARMQYYLQLVAASYQFLQLAQYPGNLDLDALLNRIDQLAQTGATTPQISDVKSLIGLYEQELSEVVAPIIDFYAKNFSALNVPVTYDLNAGQIAALNRGETIYINPTDVIPPGRENIRLVSTQVSNFNASSVNAVGRVATISVYVKHPGTSRIMKDGILYEFFHYRPDDQNPMLWGAVRDIVHKRTDAITPSLAAQSLVTTLVSVQNQNPFVALGPAPFELRAESNTDNGAILHIDSLSLDFMYEFVPQKTLKTLTVAAPANGLMPTIKVTPADVYGKTDGQPTMARSYRSAGTVTLEAQPYGMMLPAGWTDQFGQPIPSDPGNPARMTVVLNDSRTVIPVYTNPTTAAPTPATISLVSGNNQSGYVGQSLANPLVVLVASTNGVPVENVSVAFTVVTGGGRVSTTQVNTDSHGLASTTLTLGPSIAPNTVTAAASGLTGSPVTFTATATARPPTAISLSSGESQAGAAGQPLTKPLVVLVTDANNTPVENVTVTFAVTGGGGTISASQVKTDSHGLASTTLTLGTAAGTNTVTATVAGLTGSPVTFHATSTKTLTVTMNQANGQADPTGSSPINFTATFSESASGFTATDISVTGTAPGTKLVSVTGGPSIYNVAVSGMTGSGTVVATIPPNVATSAISGLGNLSSNSTDNSVSFVMSNSGQGTVSADSLTGGLGSTVQVPLRIAVDSGLTLDTISIGVQINATGSAPLLTSPLAFNQAANLPKPSLVDTGAGQNLISISWLSGLAISGPSTVIGTVAVPIPLAAQHGQTYTIRITGASASSGTKSVAIKPGQDATLTISAMYLAGDSYPKGSTDRAGNFGGDGPGPDNLDLIDNLRAVTNVPGYRPDTCSDRFDAMDTAPVDRPTSRGGDGKLDNSDLLVLLRRVTGIDLSRPTRVSRGAACMSSDLTLLAESTLRDRVVSTDPIAAGLEIGQAVVTSAGVRLPIYLSATEDLVLQTLSFSLRASRTVIQPMQFVAGEGLNPTLVDSGLPGTLAVAWLNGGLHSTHMSKLLLGYANLPGVADPSVTLQILGTSATDQSEHTVKIGFQSTGYANAQNFNLPMKGAMSITSAGKSGSGAVVPGYATILNETGYSPSGVAIFGYRTNGVLVSETGVPASAALQGARIPVEIGGPVNTGLAIANPNPQDAVISFYFTDSSGVDRVAGTTTIPAYGQTAKFLDQAPYSGGNNFQGTFTFSSTVPVAVIALRGLTNERSEFLMTTLPVLNTALTPSTKTAVLPHFADGGGWTSQVVLVNAGSSAASGNIQFVDRNGVMLNSVKYVIQRQSSFKYRTTGTGSSVQSGSVRVVPDSGSNTPIPLAIFSFRSGGVTVSEAGVSSTPASTLHTYVESFGVLGAVGSIQSGLAIANLLSSPVQVTFDLRSLDGSSIAASSLTIPPNGQVARFLTEIFAHVPTPFQGVLRISSSSAAISVVGLRARYNERGDFLITTTPPTDENSSSSTNALFFPHIVDDGGYLTQFILAGNSDRQVSGTLNFYTQPGGPLNLALVGPN